MKELLLLAKQTTHCSICDVKLNWKYGSKGRGGQSDSPTLDRINNENVINKDNIQIICWKCNTTKQDRTMQEFVDYCKMINYKFRD